MRRIFAIFLLLFLTGCSAGGSEMDRALAVRNQILTGNGCTFEAQITADYGDEVYVFSLSCAADANGNVTFTVKAPETIAGITGAVSAEGGKLTYDDTVLAFDLLADGQISPVSTPWLMIKTLRSGYISSCGTSGENFIMSIDDSYADDALHLQITVNSSNLPIRAEILWKEQCVVTLTISDFQYQ